MSLTEIMQKFSNIPYSVLQKFIEDNLDARQYKDFVDKSVKAMERHDPKGFRIDYIMRNIFYGDCDEIEKYLNDNDKWI